MTSTTKPEQEREQAEVDQSPTLATTTDLHKVQERTAIGAHIVYEAIRREGEEELKRPTSGLAWSGFAAGLSMGFSLVAEGLLEAYLPHATWAPLITKLGYSVGFLIVVLGRQQLFTENTLTVILPFLLHKTVGNAISVLRLWSVVFISNLVGTYLFAICIVHTAVFDPNVHKALLEVSYEHAGSSFGSALIRAVFAGWLIALMVWLLPGAESARVSIIIILTYIISLGGFNHIIAGSSKMLFLVVSGAESWKGYLVQFMMPTLIGNIIGGVSLVAFLGHAQVLAGKEL